MIGTILEVKLQNKKFTWINVNDLSVNISFEYVELEEGLWVIVHVFYPHSFCNCISL